MQYSKVLCIQCSKYKECPKQTRMFINYCGSRSKSVKDKIEKAFADCRSRHGFSFKYEAFVPLEKLESAVIIS